MCTPRLEPQQLVTKANEFKVTPLHTACLEGRMNIVELIVNHSNPIDLDCKTSRGDTPLHNATEKGNSEVVEYLIEKGANVNAKNNSRNTPLLIAVTNGHTAIAKMLIDHDCNLELKNKSSKTALELAKGKGDKEIIQLILKKQLKDWAPDRQQTRKRKHEEDCTICCNPKEGLFAFLPCFHAIACENCCFKICYDKDMSKNACPICRKNVTGYQKIYVP